MSKTVKVFAVILFTLGVFCQSSSAEEKKRDLSEIYYECGLGGMIFKDNGVAAAISNICSDYGTTASSSALTTPDSCKGGQEKVAAFINETYNSIEKDLASGSGDHLDTLLLLAGLDSQDQQSFIAVLRNDFASIVADPSYTDQSHFAKVEALYNLVYKHMDHIS